MIEATAENKEELETGVLMMQGDDDYDEVDHEDDEQLEKEEKNQLRQRLKQVLRKMLILMRKLLEKSLTLHVYIYVK